MPGSAPEILTVTSVLVNVNVASGYEEGVVDEVALLEDIPQTPLHTFHAIPETLPREVELSDLTKSSIAESNARSLSTNKI